MIRQMLCGLDEAENVQAGVDGFTRPKVNDSFYGVCPATDDGYVRSVTVRLSSAITQGSVKLTFNPRYSDPLYQGADPELILDSNSDLTVHWDIPDGAQKTIVNSSTTQEVRVKYEPSSDLEPDGTLDISLEYYTEYDEDSSPSGNLDNPPYIWKKSLVYKNNSFDFSGSVFTVGYSCTLTGVYTKLYSSSIDADDIEVYLKKNGSTVDTIVLDSSTEEVEVHSVSVSLVRGDEVSFSGKSGKKLRPSGQVSIEVGIEVSY